MTKLLEIAVFLAFLAHVGSCFRSHVHTRYSGHQTTVGSGNCRRGLVSQAALDREPQILRLVEPTTGVNVVLVGSMHYNPHSIELASSVCNDLASENKLGSVVIESCETRANTEQELRKEMSELQLKIYSKLLSNEMQAASQVAVASGRPVILGDQLIDITDKQLRKYASDTLKDIISPFEGWKRIADDVSRGLKALDGGEGAISFFDYAEPKLLAQMPVSLIKYPLAILVRYPFKGGAILSFLLLVSVVPDIAMAWLHDAFSVSAATPMPATTESFDQSNLELLPDLLFSLSETVFFGRLMLIPILLERNLVITESIVNACQAEASQASSNPGTVVAVLGMAHLNGVKKLIEQGPDEPQNVPA